jgi:hypothetical protein
MRIFGLDYQDLQAYGLSIYVLFANTFSARISA